jgi:hypothetical protein
VSCSAATAYLDPALNEGAWRVGHAGASRELAAEEARRQTGEDGDVRVVPTHACLLAESE